MNLLNTSLMVLVLASSLGHASESCKVLLPKLNVKTQCATFKVDGLDVYALCDKSIHHNSTTLNKLKQLNLTFLDKNKEEYNIKFDDKFEDSKITLDIFLKKDPKKQVGYVDLSSNTLFNDSIEIETYVYPEFQNKGIGSSVRQVVQDGIKKLNLPEKFIFSIVVHNNAASIAMNRKLNPSHSCQHIRWPTGPFENNYNIYFYNLK